MDELGFNDLVVERSYEISDNPGNAFAIENGMLTATSANKSGKVKVTYTIGAKDAKENEKDIIEKTISVYSLDEATAKSGVSLSAVSGMLSNIESLYKTTKVIEVKNSQTSLESLGITSSQAWKVGSQEMILGIYKRWIHLWEALQKKANWVLVKCVFTTMPPQKNAICS